MKTDKLGLVEKLGGGKYKVDPSLMSALDIYEYRGREYVINKLPGVGRKNDSPSIFYHKRGTLEYPNYLIKGKYVFRVAQNDNYTNDGNILEEVKDPRLVQIVIENELRKFTPKYLEREMSKSLDLEEAD